MSRPGPSSIGTALAFATLLLAGCSKLDTYNRPYVWHPTGANAANIAAQVANPADLRSGHGTNWTDSQAVVPAMEQVLQGQSPTLGGDSGGGAGGGSGSAKGGAG